MLIYTSKKSPAGRVRPPFPGDDVIVLTPMTSAASYSKQKEGLQISVRVAQESLIR